MYDAVQGAKKPLTWLCFHGLPHHGLQDSSLSVRSVERMHQAIFLHSSVPTRTNANPDLAAPSLR